MGELSQASHSTEGELQRGLSNRHIQLIAIGGAIGTGLFMGSGRTISVAGPSILFVYAIIGFMIFLVLRAMGELLLSNLNYKSFGDFATDILGPAGGFFVGWSYWLAWVVVGVADTIAITNYVHFWWPDLPSWIPAIVLILALLTLNLPSVKNFGEIEFWFAMIKIVAIIVLIIVGLGMVFMGFTAPSGDKAQISNIWNDGGLFPFGVHGFLAGFQIALFAFFGAELIGTTAAETKDPRKSLPRAINSVPVRIILFYVLTLTVILMVTPWRSIPSDQSPFVEMFALAGLGVAGSIVNFVVLTSAMSSANSGVFSTSRMLYGLAEEGTAPRVFAKLSKTGVPRNALYLTAVLMLSGIVLLYSGDDVMTAFELVATVTALLAMFVWSMILVCYFIYRSKRPEVHAASDYKMPGGRVSAAIALIFFLVMVVILAQDPETLKALMVLPIWFVLLTIGWFIVRKSPARIAGYKRFKEDLKKEVTF